jgi:hypothetical protein
MKLLILSIYLIPLDRLYKILLSSQHHGAKHKSLLYQEAFKVQEIRKFINYNLLINNQRIYLGLIKRTSLIFHMTHLSLYSRDLDYSYWLLWNKRVNIGWVLLSYKAGIIACKSSNSMISIWRYQYVTYIPYDRQKILTFLLTWQDKKKHWN